MAYEDEAFGKPTTSQSSLPPADPLSAFGGAGPNITTTKVNNAETESIEPEKPVDLRYPRVNNYPATISFRSKTILPWDIDVNSAISLLDVPFLFGDEGLVNKATQGRGDDGSTYDDAILRVGRKREENQPEGPGKQDRAKAATQQETLQTDTLGVKFKDTDPQKQVTLYFVPQVQIQDTVNYDTPNLGPAGTAVLAGANQGKSVLGAVMSGVAEATRAITDLFDANLRGEAAKLVVARAAEKFRNDGIGAATQLGLQVKVNPNTRSMFGGVNIRQFTFSFDFIAESAEEAAEVEQIIKYFRTELYPSSIGRSELSAPIGYKFPDPFEIKFKYNNADVRMPKPILCFLRDVSTTYNPGSMSFHADGQPSQIQMTLIFQEIRALTKEDIRKGH